MNRPSKTAYTVAKAVGMGGTCIPDWLLNKNLKIYANAGILPQYPKIILGITNKNDWIKII